MMARCYEYTILSGIFRGGSERKRKFRFCRTYSNPYGLPFPDVDKPREKRSKTHFLNRQLTIEPKKLSPGSKRSKRASHQKATLKKFQSLYNPLFKRLAIH